jgi:hypothetical protein
VSGNSERSGPSTVVFDPSEFPDPQPPSPARLARKLEEAIAPTPKYHSSPVANPSQVNADGLADQYAWIGLDPAEARKPVK